MKVLLVYPWFPDTYWSFRHALSFERKRSLIPPLGLMTVSPMLPATWEKRLVDMNVRPLTDADLDWADMVFASAMHIQKDSLDEVIQRSKARGKRVVVGGPHASISPEEVTDADHVFIGEAETTLPEFIHDLERGETKRIYNAVERPALSAAPIPDFHLLDLKRYNVMALQYSRGCPFNCEFCDIIEIYGRVPRTKSNTQMRAELDALWRAGWRDNVFIVDDNFIGNKKNVRQLLPELAEWSERHGYPFGFVTEASINLADDEELLQRMRRAGFYSVFVGIETPVVESLKETQKLQNTRRDLIDSIRKIQSHGMEVMAGFIVGFDHDPEDIFEAQIDFIRESAVPCALVSLLVALPGTQLWRRLEREGRLREINPTGNITQMNFIPKMDEARLIEGYQSILRTIYRPAEYYQRTLDFLAHLNRDGAPKLWAKVSLNDIAALVRLALRLGVQDRARSEFWRYMKCVLADHRDKLRHGIALAAIGYHLRKLTEQHSVVDNLGYL
ncbi:MAG TPA: B12-binding domain-containing radical SAM protein [Pyrinomonadaceae bacterium]|nr:B12-binding domain-containing radical SAM protein [Pyrinomonadaceae bacterium]